MSSNSGTKTVELAVAGMTCNNCKAHVTKALSDVPGVTHVDVDLQKGAARVEVGGDAADTAQLIEAVRDAGYKASVEAS
jgi:copper chaperone